MDDSLERLRVAMAAEGRINATCGRAVTLLGSPDAGVRCAGLRMLQRLGQEFPGTRQLVVDVICDYLRMYFEPPTPASVSISSLPSHGPHNADPQQRRELEVRRVAQRILTEQLAGRADELRWRDLSVSLAGATLVDFDLSGGVIAAGDFTNCRFCGRTRFDGAEFIGMARFTDARFEEEATFHGARFRGGCSFEYALFSKRAAFGWSRFEENTTFRKSRFIEDAWFGAVMFGGAVSFSSAEFWRLAIFSGAEFSCPAKFGSSNFADTAIFAGAAFRGRVSFANAFFSLPALFQFATFNRANFCNAEFESEALFTPADFGYGEFADARFNGPVSFAQASFSRPPDLTGASALAEQSGKQVWPAGWEITARMSDRADVIRREQ